MIWNKNRIRKIKSKKKMEDFSSDKPPSLSPSIDILEEAEYEQENPIDWDEALVRLSDREREFGPLAGPSFIPNAIRDFYKNGFKFDSDSYDVLIKQYETLLNPYTPFSVTDDDMVKIKEDKFYIASEMEKMGKFIQAALYHRIPNILPEKASLINFNDNYVDFDIQIEKGKRTYSVLSASSSRNMISSLSVIREYVAGMKLNEMRKKIPNFQYVFGLTKACPFVLNGKIMRWNRNVPMSDQHENHNRICIMKEKMPDMSMRDFIQSDSFDFGIWINLYIQVILSLIQATYNFRNTFQHNNLNTSTVFMKRFDSTIKYEHHFDADKYETYIGRIVVNCNYIAMISDFKSARNWTFYGPLYVGWKTDIDSRYFVDIFDLLIDSCKYMKKRFSSDKEFMEWNRYDDLLYIYRLFFPGAIRNSIINSIREMPIHGHKDIYKQAISHDKAYRFIDQMRNKFDRYIILEGNFKSLIPSRSVDVRPKSVNSRAYKNLNKVLLANHIKNILEAYKPLILRDTGKAQHFLFYDQPSKFDLYNISSADGNILKAIFGFFNDNYIDNIIESQRFLEEYEWPKKDSEIKYKEDIGNGLYIADEDENVMSMRDRSNIMISISNLRVSNARKNWLTTNINYVLGAYRDLETAKGGEYSHYFSMIRSILRESKELKTLQLQQYVINLRERMTVFPPAIKRGNNITPEEEQQARKEARKMAMDMAQFTDCSSEVGVYT